MTDVPDVAETANTPTEREKWQADQDYRREELALKRRELEVREGESRRARWSNPLVLAIAGAALAAFTNAFATYFTGAQQRETESFKHAAEQTRERQKAESQLILEVVKTANPDKAAENLLFLARARIIRDEAVANAIESYVKNRQAGEGVALPAPAGATPIKEPDGSGIFCSIPGVTNVNAVVAVLEEGGKGVNVVWAHRSASEARGSAEATIPRTFAQLMPKVMLDFSMTSNTESTALLVSARVTPDSSSLVAVSMIEHAMRPGIVNLLRKISSEARCDFRAPSMGQK